MVICNDCKGRIGSAPHHVRCRLCGIDLHDDCGERVPMGRPGGRVCKKCWAWIKAGGK